MPTTWAAPQQLYWHCKNSAPQGTKHIRPKIVMGWHRVSPVLATTPQPCMAPEIASSRSDVSGLTFAPGRSSGASSQQLLSTWNISHCLMLAFASAALSRSCTCMRCVCEGGKAFKAQQCVSSLSITYWAYNLALPWRCFKPPAILPIHIQAAIDLAC